MDPAPTGGRGRFDGTRAGVALLALLGALATLLALPPGAAAAAATRTVEFRGEVAEVPASWPVYRLAKRPRMCVRLDRRAVYLGRPSPSQRCPARRTGRRVAIVVDGRGASASAPAVPAAPVAGPAVYTGLGFDACTAPSPRAMRAWRASSPYRAIGVYIGGVNRACSQPNLTARWVAEQVAAGWHLIPTYVGLQSPTTSCTSCAKLNPATARRQGAAEADDAVADAQAVGMGPGSPIYFDMEAYRRTRSATNATLSFLAGWTTRIHQLGYQSGVYSSSASGIADLAGRVGLGFYPLPDHIWFANWNGLRTTSDPFIPANAWNRRQRIHQYRGGHDETWGGVRINIDNNYLDGGTVGPAAAGPVPPLVVSGVRVDGRSVLVRVRCGWAEETTCPGRIILRSHVRVRRRSGRARQVRVIRVGVGRRAFRLRGGRAHTFRVVLDRRGRPLLRRRGRLRAQLLVAIPGSRATRPVLFGRR